MITELFARPRVDALAAAGLDPAVPCDPRIVLIIDGCGGEMHLKLGCVHCGVVCGSRLRVWDIGDHAGMVAGCNGAEADFAEAALVGCPHLVG